MLRGGSLCYDLFSHAIAFSFDAMSLLTSAALRPKKNKTEKGTEWLLDTVHETSVLGKFKLSNVLF